MPAVVEVHGENGVAGLEHGAIDALVRLRARVRLHVHVVGAEQLLGAFDREVLGLVEHVAAAVVAPPRVALRVLVRGDRAERLEHRLGDEVLGGDQLEAFGLAARLAAQDARHRGVRLGERAASVPRQAVDLRDTQRVPAALERRRQPGLDDGPGGVGVGAVAREREHVGVVVLARERRTLDVVDQRGAHARETVRGVRHAEAAAADHDAARGFAARDRARGGGRELRVVHGARAVGADVAHLASGGREPALQRLLECVAAMVRCEHDRVGHVS